jgi:hypothetical protein
MLVRSRTIDDTLGPTVDPSRNHQGKIAPILHLNHSDS